MHIEIVHNDIGCESLCLVEYQIDEVPAPVRRYSRQYQLYGIGILVSCIGWSSGQRQSNLESIITQCALAPSFVIIDLHSFAGENLR